MWYPTLIASDAEQLAKRPHRTTPAERNVQSTAPGTLNFQSEPLACLCISLYIPATAHGRLKTTLPEDAQSLRGWRCVNFSGASHSRLLVNYVNYVPILWWSSWPVHELAKHVYLLQVWSFSDHGSVCSISKELLENIKKIQSPPLLMLLGCDCRSSGSA
jgi:hypothetical protein